MAAGFLSADHAGMGVLFDQIRAVPGVSIAVYDGGPFLFYIGQLALVVQLAVVRRVKVWTPFLVLLDLLLPFISSLPLGDHPPEGAQSVIGTRYAPMCPPRHRRDQIGPRPVVPGGGLFPAQLAEARGFEPRMGLRPKPH